MHPLDLIRSNPDAAAAFDAGDDEACVAALNLTSYEANHAVRSMAATIAALDVPACETLATVLANSPSQLARDGHAKWRSLGLDFAHPVTRTVIESHRPALGDAVTDAALALGLNPRSAALTALGRPADSDDLAAARAEIPIRNCRHVASDAWNAVSAAIDAGESDPQAVSQVFSSFIDGASGGA